MEPILILQMIGVAFISGLIGEYRRSVFDVAVLTAHQFTANVIAGALLAILLGALVYHFFKSDLLAIITTGLLSYQNTDKLDLFSSEMITKYFTRIKKK